MKKSNYPLPWIAIAFTLLSLALHAQHKEGLYKSAADFESGKLSYTEKECHLKVHSAAYHVPVKISCGDTSFSIPKDSLFGYRDHEKADHRFYSRMNYTLMNNDVRLLLYKVLSSAHSKYEEAAYSYYFSRGAAGAIRSLTLLNLADAYHDNQTFISLLEIYFKTGEELPEFDKEHTMYKLNYLLQLTHQKK